MKEVPMGERTIEEIITLEELYERYETAGISTQLNDGKISGLTKEKSA